MLVCGGDEVKETDREQEDDTAAGEGWNNVRVGTIVNTEGRRPQSSCGMMQKGQKGKGWGGRRTNRTLKESGRWSWSGKKIFFFTQKTKL